MLRSPQEIIDHTLYSGVVETAEEGLYLVAILNSEGLRKRFEGFQSRGAFGARDFHKVMFNLPIPRFDASDPLHNAIADAAREAETIAARVPLPENIKFQRARGLVRAALTEAGVAQRINTLVARLLDRA